MTASVTPGVTARRAADRAMTRRDPSAAVTGTGQDPVAAALAAVFAEAAAPGGARLPAEQVLSRWFRQRPGLGRRDRGQIADGVYHLLRHRRLHEALARHRGLADAGGPVALVAVARSLAAQAGGGRPALGDPGKPVPGGPRAGRGPAAGAEAWATAPAALIARVEAETGPLGPAERFSLPDWLWSRFVAQYGPDRAAAIAEALLTAAPTDLRVNLLRAKVGSVRDALAQAGLPTDLIEGLPHGLRIEGRAPLETLAAFQAGDFERQDAGSQRIVAFAAPRRGQTVIDFCAGAGGKTLAMASMMRNHGRILAFDPSDARLERLRARCTRAGVRIATTYRISGEDDPGLERFRERGDLVLVDAPCSGTGTLRRDPGLKWLLRPKDIDAHAARQRSILAAAASLVAPGGRLVYATCSLLEAENEAVMAAFDRAGGAGRLQWAEPAPCEGQPAMAEGLPALSEGPRAIAGQESPTGSDGAGRPSASHPTPVVSCDAKPLDGAVVPIVGSGVYSGPEEAKWTPDRDKSDGFYVAKRAPLVPAHYNSEISRRD